MISSRIIFPYVDWRDEHNQLRVWESSPLPHTHTQNKCVPEQIQVKTKHDIIVSWELFHQTLSQQNNQKFHQVVRSTIRVDDSTIKLSDFNINAEL